MELNIKVCSVCKKHKRNIPKFFNYRVKGKDALRKICRLCTQARNRKYYSDNKPLIKSKRMKSLYGLSAKEYNTMKLAQGGKCLICSKAAKLHIDHCHVTKEVRGMLCFYCNIGLGHFRDSIENLRMAIRYLKEEL